MGNYEDDLKFELECQPTADRYYMKTIKNIERIDRIDFKKSEVNRRLQYQDVDVIVKTKTGDIKISEKFRRPFGSGLNDVFIEIFSNVDTKEEPISAGSTFKSTADILCYYKNGYVCKIDAKKLKTFAYSLYKHFLTIDLTEYKLSKIEKYPVAIGDRIINGSILVSKSTKEVDGVKKTWKTMSYNISIKDLKDIMGGQSIEVEKI